MVPQALRDPLAQVLSVSLSSGPISRRQSGASATPCCGSSGGIVVSICP
jgi:hypothetical protein